MGEDGWPKDVKGTPEQSKYWKKRLKQLEKDELQRKEEQRLIKKFQKPTFYRQVNKDDPDYDEDITEA